MFLNLRPLIQYRDFRLLYLGQFISLLGSMMSYVAIPYQMFQLTQSSAMVGAIGIAQLIPTVVFGILGGSVADSMDRRKLLLYSELFLGVAVIGLAINAMIPQPSIAAIFILTILIQSAVGFHRPAMDAAVQKLVDANDYATIGALGGFRFSVGSILGPAMGGILIASFGASIAYWVDAATFLISFLLILAMKRMPSPERARKNHAEDIKEGLRYAFSRPVLMGSYVVDIIAMTFAFPVAIFPEMSVAWGGAKAAGVLFSAMSIGSLVMTIFSGWTPRVKRHGAAIIISASIWGVAIIALAYAPNLTMAVVCLAVAGAADMVSGLFRGILWNETIPNSMRGRMSGIEMISYMSGPLLGNARVGYMASHFTIHISVLLGGVICTIGVIACVWMYKEFWEYSSSI
ncbi:MAG: MFS transporter [Xanthomonadaceae bacterium]|nr:MFS transporter [Xanthomonadaceae bacterium]